MGLSRDQPHSELVYRPLQFHERSQLFIGANDETLFRRRGAAGAFAYAQVFAMFLRWPSAALLASHFLLTLERV